MSEGPALPLSHTFRVRYAECDLQGIVFNPHYLAYMDIEHRPNSLARGPWGLLDSR